MKYFVNLKEGESVLILNLQLEDRERVADFLEFHGENLSMANVGNGPFKRCIGSKCHPQICNLSRGTFYTHRHCDEGQLHNYYLYLTVVGPDPREISDILKKFGADSYAVISDCNNDRDSVERAFKTVSSYAIHNDTVISNRCQDDD